MIYLIIVTNIFKGSRKNKNNGIKSSSFFEFVIKTNDLLINKWVNYKFDCNENDCLAMC